jgi:hypothetical protein
LRRWSPGFTFSFARQENQNIALKFDCGSAPQLVHAIGNQHVVSGHEIQSSLRTAGNAAPPGGTAADTMMTGAGPNLDAKWSAKRCASIVAEVTMILSPVCAANLAQVASKVNVQRTLVHFLNPMMMNCRRR